MSRLVSLAARRSASRLDDPCRLTAYILPKPRVELVMSERSSDVQISALWVSEPHRSSTRIAKMRHIDSLLWDVLCFGVHAISLSIMTACWSIQSWERYLWHAYSLRIQYCWCARSTRFMKSVVCTGNNSGLIMELFSFTSPGTYSRQWRPCLAISNDP